MQSLAVICLLNAGMPKTQKAHPRPVLGAHKMPQIKKAKAKPKSVSGQTKATLSDPAESQQPKKSFVADFPVVGIGASAGGLAAFESFFSGMPPDVDPGMAFVLVQHLAPDHKSILVDLVRRYTLMQVFEVEDGMTVQPNCAYIIPPGRDMAFLNGALQLLEPSAPRGLRLPIDFFFRSLAQDQRERAICVILSGTGSDGTLGVRSIKGEGGMVMVQKPESAEYDGMPRSALATGLVDFELPPAEMPAQIIAYVTHALGRHPSPAAVQLPKIENALKKIFIQVRDQTGHDFSQYKPSTIYRRVERRMAVHQIESMDGYVKFLQQDPSEVKGLFRDLLIGVTSFFRDKEAFNALEQQVIPRLFTEESGEKNAIRVWSVGCSTGEEAYSLAILLAEHRDKLKQSVDIQVFATDIDSQAIATARDGLYSASIAPDITRERLARFFVAEPDGSAFRIHKKIRNLMIFSEQDVIKDPPFSRLDLICCRNLLIYMGGELQKKIIPLFHYSLNPGGFLFLGTSETVGDFNDLFVPLDRKLKLFERKDDHFQTKHAALGFFSPSRRLTAWALPPTTSKTESHRKPSLRELTEQALLRQMSPVAALINSRGDILYLHGRAGSYLEPAAGEAGTNNILNMAREGLKHNLTIALHSVTSDQKLVSFTDLRVKNNGNYIFVNLTVFPIAAGSNTGQEADLYMVILEKSQVSELQTARQEGSSFDHGGKTGQPDLIDTEARIAALEQELRAKEEYLLTSTEELQTSNEELRSSNEEMQSVNEELQSTNEELETSKEELQSVNEELSTVNSELQTNVAELTRANNDMNNLLAGTGIGTIFIDHDLRILRFTPSATRIINLILSDVGRPVAHIASNLVGYDHLVEDIKAVLDTLISKEVEVQTRVGSWYTMRILPYRTLDNVIEGAVLTFVDITEMKKAREELERSQKLYLMLAQSSTDRICIFNRDETYRFVNTAFARALKRKPGEIVGKTLDDFFLPDEDGRQITLIRRVLAGGEEGEVLSESVTGSGEKKAYQLQVKPVGNKHGKPFWVLCLARDVSDSISSEQRPKPSEAPG
jgi:two-component system CheB/CheR fusion protein